MSYPISSAAWHSLNPSFLAAADAAWFSGYTTFKSKALANSIGNFSTEQYNTRVQGLVEIMQERKEERLANGEEVYTNFENTKETDWSKETIKH